MSDDWEYVITRREDSFGEWVRETRHEAVGFAAILEHYSDEEFEVNARKAVTNKANMTDDALWRAEITDKTGDEWEHVGWTLLHEARSFAADAAYRYMLANHLDEVSVRTMPWYGQEYDQVGALLGSDGTEYPIYLGYDEGEPAEHDANALQYSDFFNGDTYTTIDLKSSSED